MSTVQLIPAYQCSLTQHLLPGDKPIFIPDISRDPGPAAVLVAGAGAGGGGSRVPARCGRQRGGGRAQHGGLPLEGAPVPAGEGAGHPAARQIRHIPGAELACGTSLARGLHGPYRQQSWRVAICWGSVAVSRPVDCGVATSLAGNVSSRFTTRLVLHESGGRSLACRHPTFTGHSRATGGPCAQQKC